MKRPPPFAQSLAERQKFQNLPFFVVVCTGRHCWPRARRWNAGLNDCVGLVYRGGESPDRYAWPVSQCARIVEWDVGPNAGQITGLIKTLLLSGARSVTSRLLFIDPDKTAWRYDPDLPIGKRWLQTREIIRTLIAASQQGSRNAA